MMLSRPSGARLTVKDRKGRVRVVTATLVEDEPPGTGWHYEARVEPSESGRRVIGEPGEPLERVVGRLMGQINPGPRRASRRDRDGRAASGV